MVEITRVLVTLLTKDTTITIHSVPIQTARTHGNRLLFLPVSERVPRQSQLHTPAFNDIPVNIFKSFSNISNITTTYKLQQRRISYHAAFYRVTKN